MRPDTTHRALAVLPATREQMAQRLRRSKAWATEIAKHLIDSRLAHEWGTELTPRGTLAPVLHKTEKL